MPDGSRETSRANLGQRSYVGLASRNRTLELLDQSATYSCAMKPEVARRPPASASVGGPPSQDDEQHHEPNKTGGYRAQHRWRGGARLLVRLLSAGLDAF